MRYRDFNHNYLFHVFEPMRTEFPGLVSYNRFVELMQTALFPLAVYLKTLCLGKCTGVSFVDSTPIRACHLKLEHSNKVLKVLTTKGQCIIGNI